MSTIAKLNCRTTNTLRGLTAEAEDLNVPFSTFTGLNDERKNAG